MKHVHAKAEYLWTKNIANIADEMININTFVVVEKNIPKKKL